MSLGLTALPVMVASATSITTARPESLEAGTYLLLLTRSDQQTAAFYVTVDGRRCGVAVTARIRRRRRRMSGSGPTGP